MPARTLQRNTKRYKIIFEEIIRGIYRLKIPFDTVYTSVFLVLTEEGAVLVDCATTDQDVDMRLLPALQAMGREPSNLPFIVVTHDHGDHAGGLARILHHAPHAEVVTIARPLLGGLEAYPLYGHTNGMIGLFDARTGTLISGDGLQGTGVDKFRCYAENKQAYWDTLQRIRDDGRIINLVFSHAYEPWFEDRVFGRDAVLKALEECKKYM